MNIIANSSAESKFTTSKKDVGAFENDIHERICKKMKAVICHYAFEDQTDKVTISAEFGKQDVLTVSVSGKICDHEKLDDFLQHLTIDFEKVEQSKSKTHYHFAPIDIDDFETAIDQFYWIAPPASSFEEVRDFVLANWDLPNFRVEMAVSDDGKEYVFVLVSGKQSADDWSAAILRLESILKSRFAFSLRAHFKDSHSDEYARATMFGVPAHRFQLRNYPEKHIPDCLNETKA